jgi:cytochrome c
MFNWLKSPLLLGLLAPACWGAAYPDELQSLGRAATPAELAAWDIDVRPDFKGLPAGSGSVAEGEELWLAQCSSCHGDFGDSNEVFSPIVLGNVTEADIEAGRVAALTDPAAVRTTFMKVATLSTLWDYINRAMPWNAPKSLATDEVYALLAYLLNLAYIVDEEFTLSDSNIRDVQALMPNRNGMTTDHGMWTVDGTPDVSGSDCVRDCTAEVSVASFIPAYAMNAHGNLKDQMRDYGPYPGLQTAPEELVAPAANEGPTELLSSSGCLGCHQLERALVGPALTQIQERYAGQDASDYLTRKIREGGAGVWGSVPMPGMPQLDDETISQLAAWLANGSTER